MKFKYRKTKNKSSYLHRRSKPIDIEIGSKTKKFVRADILVAGMAALISLAALHATIEGQRLDRYYREASIRPRIAATYSDENNGLSIRNDGTGPAVISQIAIMGLRDNYSPYPDVPELEDNQSRSIQDKIRFQRDVAAVLFRVFGRVSHFNPYRHVTFPNWHVSSIVPGSHKDLFKINKAGMISDLESLAPILPQSSVKKARKAIDDIMPMFFAKHAVMVCYCSITYSYCKADYWGPISHEDQGNYCLVQDDEYMSMAEIAFDKITSAIDAVKKYR